jgi:ketosteroid isomerase-like protein
MRARAGRGDAALRAAEQELLSAVRSRNLARLSRLFAPEYVFTSGSGQTWGRDHALGEFDSPDLCITKLAVEVDKVIQLRDAGVVTGRSHVEGRIGATSISGIYRFTRVWRRSWGRWVIVATHTSPLAGSGRG